MMGFDDRGKPRDQVLNLGGGKVAEEMQREVHSFDLVDPHPVGERLQPVEQLLQRPA